MRRTLLLGLLLFLAFAVIFAPAGLVRLGLAPVAQVSLLEPRGTLWSGSGRLLVATRPLGTLEWHFQPVTLLKGSLGYQVALAGDALDLHGNFALTPRAANVQISGTARAPSINPWLEPYAIELSGKFALNQIELNIAGGRLRSAGGEIAWSGGPIHYELSGRPWSGDLPQLVGYLGSGPEATVYAKGSQTPLIRAELLDNGFAKVGITKLLTIMLNNPWPGSDPDHAVVLEVEEQVF